MDEVNCGKRNEISENLNGLDVIERRGDEGFELGEALAVEVAKILVNHTWQTYAYPYPY